MPSTLFIETLLSARRIDVDDPLQLAACRVDRPNAAIELRAMIDVFRPLSESFALFVTR